MTPTLSIRQPWAWCIAMGFKPIENRDWKSWNTGLKFRGDFLIHAGKKIDTDAWSFIRDVFPDILLPDPHVFMRPGYTGGIIGRGKIVDCVTHHSSPWFFGPYGFVIENAEPLPFMPYKGQLGFFNVEYNSHEN